MQFAADLSSAPETVRRRVVVNGAVPSAGDLVARARALGATFDAPGRSVRQVVESGDRKALEVHACEEHPTGHG
jgi:hypothetical protein